MNLKRKDLQLFELLSKNGYIDTPANLEYSDGSKMAGHEFRCLVNLRAALSTLQSMGIVDPTITLDMNEPFTEDFDC